MKRLTVILLALILSLTCLCANGEGGINIVTIEDWLNAKGECGTCAVLAIVEEVVNPMLAVIRDETASVRLFAEVYAAGLRDGDALLLLNPTYNLFEGEVEMAFPEIVRRVPTGDENAVKRLPAFEFEYEANPEEPTFISDLIFRGDVTVSGVGQMVYFSNCVFCGNVTLASPEATIVYIDSACAFENSSKCFIDNDVTGTTIDYNMPKFVLEIPAEVECAYTGNVITIDGVSFKLNGRTYDSDEYSIIQTSDGSVIPYDESIPCSMHAAAHWWEDGVEQLVTVGVE